MKIDANDHKVFFSDLTEDGCHIFSRQHATKPSKQTPQLPRWIPRWMGERELAAFIVAIGIVLGAAVVAIGILTAFENISWRL